MTRDMTSSPSGSTPNGWAAVGPMGVPKASVRFGFWTLGPGSPNAFTTSGAKMAIRISRMMNPAETIATRSERNRRQKSWSGERAVISPPTSSTVST